MTDWNDFRDRLLDESPETRSEYEKLRPHFQVIADAIRTRLARGLTQAQLAKMMGTQQPAIARFEAGRVNPSVGFLQEMADALGTKLTVRFETLEPHERIRRAATKKRRESVLT